MSDLVVNGTRFLAKKKMKKKMQTLSDQGLTVTAAPQIGRNRRIVSQVLISIVDHAPVMLPGHEGGEAFLTVPRVRLANGADVASHRNKVKDEALAPPQPVRLR